MAEDATSTTADTMTSDPSAEAPSANDNETAEAEQLLAEALSTDTGADSTTGESAERAEPEDEKLREPGKRALVQEREARRSLERQLGELRGRLAEYEDGEKTELQRVVERAEAAEQTGADLREENARLVAAATHHIPAKLIKLLGGGTDEQINERAELLAAELATPDSAAPAPAEPAPATRPAPARPVESLTPGARPSGDAPTDPNDVFRAFVSRRRA